ADLRDSGQWEQDADVILFLCWPHRIDTAKDPHEYMIFCAKNRNRPIVTAALKTRFRPSRQMIEAETRYETEQGVWTEFSGWQ
ncbi:MAG: DnaB-like helicase C-terminal domain-containing protein, partial [Planctomycetota bacterium]